AVAVPASPRICLSLVAYRNHSFFLSIHTAPTDISTLSLHDALPISRFQRAALHQRIAPAAQRRNVHVDPVVPPVDRFGGKTEKCALFGRQSGREQPRIFRFEDVFVVEDEWLVKLDELLHTDELALRFGKWRLLHAQRDGHAIDAGNEGFLHGNRKPLVAQLGNRNCFKLYLEPTVDTLGRAVVLAVREPRQFDAASHVHRIDRGSRQLVYPGMTPGDYGGSDERHPAADHVDRDHVQALPLIRGKLAEIRAKEIRQRPGGIDA